jgi:3-phenylpropionate/trans-cinnamate dioxygenase ferredoxin reductase subunit
MEPPSSVVIAGTGLAGYQVAASLREHGYGGAIIAVGEEEEFPYQRPPLSKAYLAGAVEESRLALRPENYYADKQIELRRGRRVVALDVAHRRVALDDETVLDYGHFVFAVGARNRPLPIPGADLEGVRFLRTLAEARALKARLASLRRVVVIGAGFIGLEFARVAAKHGIEVTVIELENRPMARALSPAMSAVFARDHAAHGIRFLFGTQTLRLLGMAGAVRAVELMDHGEVPADLVLIGIGVIPNVEVAAAANLEVRNGIVVDSLLATADPHVSAIGDCAAHPNPHAAGALVRLESVQNATDQGKSLAARLMGKPAPYASVPWFWSDQGDLKLQIAGLTAGCDRTVFRGDPNGTQCSVFCFHGGRLVGVESVNRTGDHMVARRLLAAAAPLTPVLAADESFELKSLLR